MAQCRAGQSLLSCSLFALAMQANSVLLSETTVLRQVPPTAATVLCLASPFLNGSLAADIQKQSAQQGLFPRLKQ